MDAVRLPVVIAALFLPALLGVLSATAGLPPIGWVAGLAAGWTATALMAVARVRRGEGLLPADQVTLARALLSAGVAALVVPSADRPLPVTEVVVLAAVALALDAVDGQLARRTRTATPLGGRFDGEVDAFLILVLSVAVAREHGGWVLAIGAARYAFLVAGWALPWLAGPLPFRYWRKVVTAVQGIVLTVAVSGLLPDLLTTAALVVALLLLTESFGRDVVRLYRDGAGPRTRRALRWTVTAAAVAVLWAVLVAPDRLDQLRPAAFARVPIEGLTLVAVGLLLPAWVRRPVVPVVGVVCGLLAVAKLLDMGFHSQLGRRFDPLVDWGSFGPAIGVVRDSIGDAATNGLLVVVGVAVVLLVVVVTASLVRVSGVTARHRRRSARTLAVLGVVWGLSAALSLQLVPGTPVASANTAGLVAAQVREVAASAQEQRQLEEALRSDEPVAPPAWEPLSGLQGTDVFIVFVESYGEVSVRGGSFSPGIRELLGEGAAELARDGWSAQSAFLDSPTLGGASWLAHATLQAGLWIDNEQSYAQLLASGRPTLASVFGEEGWRTVAAIPANDRDWPEGQAFYGWDQIYDRRTVGYEGPRFSYAPMPDQYTLAAFQRLELGPGHAPVMAEIDLVSSHSPWTPLPTLVPWEEVGDGSVFDPMARRGLSAEEALADPEALHRLYGESIEYSLQVVLSWLTTQVPGDPVVVLVGDHQPATVVSGPDAGRHVPVSIIARDPGVFDRIAGWQWQDGLLPAINAPRWPMDAFRDRFLDAFSAP
ncbi:CDP-alcohol phosphatidyltransferase family protein [Modestobacter sp. VKM Ac-2985]|uniref:CDP-alcohol phosphatidyltransferase family protein n=1 Tax=Modestobacter sp. VKM Ac-2985 TaxID=3004139 RepID=UPI0022ABA045|nr:CDP-alcohol phosphatidyltransferase family protein [Modestobacter sp. VKM Ac-2985]MCZ2836987.1 CDP-alcohol phosphatidyltransferase family protein [Modestobacter sp. VKM Ac-2985]